MQRFRKDRRNQVTRGGVVSIRSAIDLQAVATRLPVKILLGEAVEGFLDRRIASGGDERDVRLRDSQRKLIEEAYAEYSDRLTNAWKGNR